MREVRFDPHATADRVTVNGGTDPGAPTTTSPPPTPSAVIEHVVVRAPPGWIVGYISGWDYSGRFSKQVLAHEVDLPAFDTKRPYTIVFAKEAPGTPGTESPGPVQTIHATRTVTVTAGAVTDDSRDAESPGALLFVAALARVGLKRCRFRQPQCR